MVVMKREMEGGLKLKILKMTVLICFPKYEFHRVMKSWVRERKKSGKCQAQRCTVKSPIL